jgi:hypothetical protein
MPSMKVVPPDASHAPASLQLALSSRARCLIAIAATTALFVGVLGWVAVGPHPLFVVAALLGALGAVALLPLDFPVVWSQFRS